MPELPTELADALPQSSIDAFAKVYPERPADSSELLAGLIRSHLEVVDQAALGEAVDTHLARVLADRLLKLLESWELLSEDERAAAHATVTYYVLSDDADGDLKSPTGFEDDAHVANACFTFLGRPDLFIEMD